MNILDLCDDLIKAGEGSRGGKVIGHTKSGKPVYEKSRHNQGYSSQDHLDAAEHYHKTTKTRGAQHNDDMDEAAKNKWHHMGAAERRKHHETGSKHQAAFDTRSGKASLSPMADYSKKSVGELCDDLIKKAQ